MLEFLFILFLIIGIIDLFKTHKAKRQNDREAPGRIARRAKEMEKLKELQNKKYWIWNKLTKINLYYKGTHVIMESEII